MLEPLQRKSQMGPSLALGHGVDLVDDHRLDPGEDLAGAGGEHQVERLGGRDQDVRRRFAHRAALGLGRVPRAQADGDVGAYSPQRRPQVALDVVRQRLQRRDVDDPHPPPTGRYVKVTLTYRPVGGCGGGEAVDPPEERRQRLARAGGGADQRAGTARDRLPAAHLGWGRALEGGLEPAPDRIAERRQRIGSRTRFRLSGQSTDPTPSARPGGSFLPCRPGVPSRG